MADVRVLVSLWFLACISYAGCENPIQKQGSLEEVEAFLAEYEKKAQDVYSASALASWEYNTNITDYNSQKSVSILLKK